MNMNILNSIANFEIIKIILFIIGLIISKFVMGAVNILNNI